MSARARRKGGAAPPAAAAEKALRIEYVDVETVALWDVNPKRHDEAGLRRSIMRYGFRDAPIYDATLGALAAGNGRTKVAAAMFREGAEPPEYVIARGGRWMIPVQMGGDAANMDEAVAFAVDHNNLTLGPGFSAIEVARLWDDDGYRGVLGGLAEVEQLPATVDPTAIQAIEAIRALPPADASPSAASVRPVATDALRRHPRYVLDHPPDALAHLAAMIRQFGHRRPVEATAAGDVLAGWDVVEAARALGDAEVPAILHDLAADDPRALKIMVAAPGSLRDVRDDRGWADLLREVKDSAPGGLEGTGFDEEMLAGLVLVTRGEREIADFDAAAAWVGLPSYEQAGKPFKVVINFVTEADRAEFGRVCGIELLNSNRRTATAWWPPKMHDDHGSVKFVG
jgi:hypothetical protein